MAPFYKIWQIEVIQNGRKLAEVCKEHNISTTLAYTWLNKHPKVKEAYMKTQAGRKMKFAQERRRKNPSSARRAANLLWAARVKWEALQERRAWLWMLLEYEKRPKARRIFEKELSAIEKEIRKYAYQTRIKRRNSDDNICQLERKMIATTDPQDVVAYWRACLQADKLPVGQIGQIAFPGKWADFFDRQVSSMHWDIEPLGDIVGTVNEQSDKRGIEVMLLPWEEYRILYWNRYGIQGGDENRGTKLQAAQVVKEILASWVDDA